MARVVIVGAGLAGLATAARLGDLRHHVTVLESASHGGGQLASSPTDGGTVGLNGSTFTLPAPLRDLFRSTGRPIERELDLVPVDPSMRVVFPDGTDVDLPNASRAGSMRALDDALGPGAGSAWDGVLDHGNHNWQHLHDRFLGYNRRAPDRDGRSRGAMPELADARLRAMLEWYAASVGEDPSQLPPTVTILPYLEQTFGTWTFGGGMRRLVDAVHKRAQERGATVRTGTRVTGITTHGGRISGVTLADGDILTADVVVSTTHPANLASMLPDQRDVTCAGKRGRIFRGRRRAADAPGRSVFSLEFLAPGGIGGRPQRVVLPPGDDQPAAMLSRTETMPGDGRTAWILQADCEPHGTGPGKLDWTAPGVAESHATALLEVAATALRSHTRQLETRLWRSPDDLRRLTGAPGGTVHGVPLTGAAAYPNRVGARTRVDGLFLAGAGVHPGPGIPMTVISTGIAADLIGRA